MFLYLMLELPQEVIYFAFNLKVVTEALNVSDMTFKCQKLCFNKTYFLWNKPK